MLNRHAQRGDTLIEVLLALTVLAMAITISMRAMNSGFGNLLVSVQRSETQALMNGQLAVLRAAHDKAIAGDATDWNAIRGRAVLSTSGAPVSPIANGCTPLPNPAQKFFFDTSKVSGWTIPTTIAGVPTNFVMTNGYPTPGQAMWVEAIRTDDGQASTRDYIDFYIKACWNMAGEQQQIKSTMRLYDV